MTEETVTMKEPITVRLVIAEAARPGVALFEIAVDGVLEPGDTFTFEYPENGLDITLS